MGATMLCTQDGQLQGRFTADDFDYVRGVLAPASGRAGQALGRLWEDPDALREILDLREIFTSLLEDPDPVGVSPAFYFYVLARHAFLDVGVEDVEAAEYVSSVLARRVESAGQDPLHSVSPGFTRVADFITILQRSHGRLRFHLQVAAGDQFLTLTGMFPGYLRKRAERRGTPGLEFYEAFVQRVYRDASDNPLAPSNAPCKTYGVLSESFPQARRALNRVVDEFVFLGD
jgi:hypothetical protein